jgi:hypothetical protein
MVRDDMPDPLSRFSAAMPDSAAPLTVARRLPGLARHAQHRALAGPGIADHDREIAPVRDTRKRVDLLARKDNTARFRTRQSGFAIRVTHLMALPFNHQFGGVVQASFRLDHLPRGEPILAASVLAEFDQIGRSAHRAHDLVELVDPIAVTMREDSHIPACEGRLLMRDRVQPEGRIGDDPRSIAARDLPVQFGAVGLLAFALDAPILNTSGGRSDLALRLQCDALRFETAMVDARVNVEFGQSLIGKFGPALTPALDHLGAVPVSHLWAKTVLVH